MSAWRKGQWVNYKGRIAIHLETRPKLTILGEFLGWTSEVHLVKVDGTTDEIVFTDPANLIPAAVRDIPESRRPTPVVAAKLGYMP
jgi:hypothetical protein